jgi:CHAT domain-containing protein/tetratricopeptide (TPR) repeat protein
MILHRSSFIRLSLFVSLAVLGICAWWPAPAQLQEAVTLKPFTPVARELASGQQHEFQILLVGNQYLRLAVEHTGLEVTVTLLAPGGQPLYEIEGGSDPVLPTSFAALTSRLGQYRIRVKSRASDEAPHRYEINIAELRSANPHDEQRITAERFVLAGDKQREERTPEARRTALKNYGEAYRIYQAIADRQGEGAALHGLGRTYNDLGERENAREYLERALAARRAANDRRGEGTTLHNLAGVYNNLGDLSKARATFDLALQVRRELGDKRGELMTLNGLGQLYAGRGDFKQAVPFYEEVQKLAHATGDRRAEAEALFGLGRAARQRGNPKQALELYEQTLPLYQAVGNRAGEASALQGLGVVYLELGEREKAIDHLTSALSLARAAKNRGLEANILSPLASAYGEGGDTRKEIELSNEALAIWREVNNPRSEATLLSNLAMLYRSLGERQRALDLFKESLDKAVKFGGARGTAPQLQGLATTYNELGEKQQALDYFLQALEVARQLKDPVFEASTLENLGILYNSLGDQARAAEQLEKALSIAQRVNNPRLETSVLLTLAWFNYGRGEQAKALEYFDTVQTRKGSSPGTVIDARNGAALIYNEQQQRDRALDVLKRALSEARKLGSRAAEATTLHNLGWVSDAGGDRAAAREYFTQALQLNRETGNRSSEAATLFGLAKLERDDGNLDAARTQIEAALDVVENLRAKVASQELRTSFFASVRKYYDLYLDVLMQLDQKRPGEGFSAQALQASERARARSLLEILTEARADIRQGVDAKLVARERELQDLLNGKAEALLQFKLRKGGQTQAEALAKELDELTRELQQLRAEIRRQSPRYATLTQPQPLSLPEIQARVLDADTLLLEYALGEERSYLWTVTPTSLRSYVLPKRAEIEQAAERVYQLLTTRKQTKRAFAKTKARSAPSVADAQYWRAAQALGRMILQPVASQLGHKRLLIVAEGALQFVPFSALPEPVARTKAANRRQPLIVKHEIISLPSASTLAVLRDEIKDRPAAPKAVAVFADPVFAANDERLNKTAPPATKASGKESGSKESGDVARTLILKKVTTQATAEDAGEFGIRRLRFTRAEAERIAGTGRREESTVALDFAANRAALFNPELSQYRIVHIATHGLLDTERPELSALVFSLVDEQGQPQDGFLRAHEVYNLNLPSELVVLSACETGLGKQVRGEGLVGLTRGFMYAGAARVLVSLWAVSDRGTSELMARFYRNLLKDGARPAAALRAAQIEMWRAGRWQAPYYWAPFVLQGEWR